MTYNPTRRHLLKLAAASALALATGFAHAADTRIPVVASFSILGDLVHQIGGDRVQVTTLVGPDEDAHEYQGKPSDAKTVAAARLVVANGLGFDNWLQRLAQSSGAQAAFLTASDGIPPLKTEDEEAHGHDEHDHDHDGHDHDHDGHDHDHDGHDHEHDGHDHEHEGHNHEEHAHEHEHEGHGHHHHHGGLDPHAWQSPLNVKTYVANIAAALEKIDPDGKAHYAQNLADYQKQLDQLDHEYRAFTSALAKTDRTLITNHDAFGYLANAYGLQVKAPSGVSGESQPSAATVARIIQQIRAEKVRAVFLENISDPRMMEQISKESGARIGGKLYSDALSAPNGEAPTYLDMMRHNLSVLTAALAPTKN